MCIFLSLETLLVCIFMIIDCYGYLEYRMGFWEYGDILTRLHYHLTTPDRILSEEFWIFCIGAILCTLLSMRFKWFYRVYEGFHFLLGIYGFGNIIGSSLLMGLIYLLITSARFCIYLFIIRKRLEQHE